MKLNRWEQISSDTNVKWNIVHGELWQIDILQGSKTDLVLSPHCHVELSAQVTTSSQDSLQGSHTEIVVILSGELLRGQPE